MVFFPRSYLHADSGVKLGFDFGLSLLGPGLILKPVFATSLHYFTRFDIIPKLKIKKSKNNPIKFTHSKHYI